MQMQKKYLLNQLVTIALALALVACGESSSQKKIGIIVPIQHKAMDDIVDGFTTTLRTEYPLPITFKIANAEGDINTQRAIIQQMKDEHYDIVAPIGLAATQMTVAMIHEQPIVSIAASISEADRKKLHPCNLAVADDEIAPEKIISFIHQAYPDIKNISLVHSASEKIFPDVKAAIAAGKKFGITITPKMISALSELYSVANSIPSNTQAIFILKDNLIVSGVNTLAMIAAKNHIPLITSDEGSVQENAALALGVHEREIGVQSATLANDILSGKPACSLPIVTLGNLTVFVNRDALQKENQSLEKITAAANAQHYHIEFVGQTKVNE
jgi:putative ABC transport system substrate-binding protein